MDAAGANARVALMRTRTGPAARTEEQKMNTQIRELTAEETSLVGGGADQHWNFNIGPLHMQGNWDTGAWSLWIGGKFVISSDK
jgi:hypothetical protein